MRMIASKVGGFSCEVGAIVFEPEWLVLSAQAGRPGIGATGGVRPCKGRSFGPRSWPGNGPFRAEPLPIPIPRPDGLGCKNEPFRLENRPPRLVCNHEGVAPARVASRSD